MTKIYLLLATFLISLSATAQKKPTAPEIGVVQNMENDSLLRAIGFTCLVESTREILSPRTVTDQQFQNLLPAIKQLEVPLYGCNLFIPGDLKVVGPAVDEQAVLEYVDVVIRRAKAAGVTLITWGSGGIAQRSERGLTGSPPRPSLFTWASRWPLSRRSTMSFWPWRT